MEPHSNNLENRAKNTPEIKANTPELVGESQNRKMDHVPIGALEQLNEGAVEQQPISDNNVQAIAGDATTLPSLSMPSSDATTSTSSVDPTSPAAAADDDVIEKEWVNKAKKVISQTKGDPYEKEKEVSKLQADYMQKRYGKQIKMPDEG